MIRQLKKEIKKEIKEYCKLNNITKLRFNAIYRSVYIERVAIPQHEHLRKLARSGGYKIVTL